MKRAADSASPALESLHKEARQWLKALRAADAAAWRRLHAVLPGCAPQPTLRQVQLALARERGFEGWSGLTQAAAQAGARRPSRSELAAEMLRHMTWRGEPDIGARLLARHPQLSGVDFLTAVATGNMETVRVLLAQDAAVASRAGGPLQWEPLLYLAYSRLPGHDAHALEIARLLLDHGADANARWQDDWENPFTVLAGVIAGGEGVKPVHPCAAELVALLLERGADPCDTQALYNDSIVADDTRWLETLWNASVARDLTHRWREPPPPGAGGRERVNQLDYLLGNTVTHGHPRRAAWLLEHGASADCIHIYSGRRMLELAELHGATAIAALLRRHGAPERPLPADVAFRIACRQGDFAQAAAIIARSPGIIAHPEPLQLAAALDRIELIDLLLGLGMPVDLQDAGGSRALHAAVAHDARRAVRHLLRRGALVDTPTKLYGGALGTAAWLNRRECAALLAPHSRDVHNMTSLGLRDRLVELLAAEPGLVNLPHFRLGTTALFWLPQEQEHALAMARLLLDHGADRTARDPQGRSAAELARLRGAARLARLLGGGAT